MAPVTARYDFYSSRSTPPLPGPYLLPAEGQGSTGGNCAPRSTAKCSSMCTLCLVPPEVLPDFPARPPVPDYGLNLWPERATAASALLRRAALQCYLQTVHTHETLPPRTPPRTLVIFGKGQQRAAASCLELRAGFLGNLSCGGARWETLGRVGAPGPWWQATTGCRPRVR